MASDAPDSGPTAAAGRTVAASPAATATVGPRLARMRGLSDYEPTLAAMREFTRTRGPETGDEIWLLEHPPVFTLGLAGRREHLLEPGGIPVVSTERGGQVTYHGPGQVIAYTLIDLHRLGIGARELVYRIEQAVIQTLAAYGVAGRRVAGAPGVYVGIAPAHGDRAGGLGVAPADDDRAPGEAGTAGGPAGERRPRPDFRGLAKIAALGVKISRGCSFHGVAVNVAMDLAPFERVDPCGYPGLRTVDLRTLGVDASVDEVAQTLGERLGAHLQAERAPKPVG